MFVHRHIKDCIIASVFTQKPELFTPDRLNVEFSGEIMFIYLLFFRCITSQAVKMDVDPKSLSNIDTFLKLCSVYDVDIDVDRWLLCFILQIIVLLFLYYTRLRGNKEHTTFLKENIYSSTYLS